MPERTCIVCRNKNEKKNLIRVVTLENGEALIDEKQNINSRAVYFCNNKCFEKFLIMSKRGKIKLNNKINIKSIEKLIEDKIV